MGIVRTRVIPCLLLKNDSLVKTVKFKEYNYVGDPINTVRIFNELEVDELVFLDIDASRFNKPPSFYILADIAVECFMPLAYGGGIRRFEDAQRVFDIGFEKVVLNSAAFENPKLIEDIARVYGSQAVIVSIDYKKNMFGNVHVMSHGGKIKQELKPAQWAVECERRGAGEILLTSIDRDGTWSGYDYGTIKEIAQALTIPLVANGGAGKVDDFRKAVKEAGASAVAAGSMVVYQKKDMGILVNFPDKAKLDEALGAP